MTHALSRRLLLLLSAAAVVTPACIGPTPAPIERGEATPVYGVRAFFDTTRIRGASFSSDGERILFTSDASGVPNAWSVPTAGGAPTQLTQSAGHAIQTLEYFPGDDRFLYLADQGGNELDHVYVRELDGSVVDLTPGDGLKARYLGWSDDDAVFWVATNERDERAFDLYRYRVTDGSAEQPYVRESAWHNPGSLSLDDVSRDGRWLAVSRVRNNADSDVLVVDLEEGGEPRLVTEHEGDVVHTPAGFSPDGKALLYLSNEGSEFDRLWAFDLGSAERSLVFEAAWDVWWVTHSRDGRYRALAVNADAKTRIRVRDLERREPVALPELPSGDVTSVEFSPDGRHLAFYVNGDTSPSNLHVMDLASGEHRRLTTSLSAGIEEAHLVASEVVRFASWDGLEVPCLLYRPRNASADEPVPAVVLVHGGPGGQTRVGWNSLVQLLVNHGFCVLAINNRGSSGYGKTFFHLDDRAHGDVDLKDCIAAHRWLADLDWVDGRRIGILGGSYGGYMVVAALAFAPEVFRCGIDIFGVTNWLRTLESIPPWWEDFREALYAEMGDPETDRERLHAISPLFHAENIRAPLLVVQGANDPRVLQVESDELVDAVRENGTPVEYIVFEDEGHGFQNRENRVEAAEAYLRFLDEHLRGAAP